MNNRRRTAFFRRNSGNALIAGLEPETIDALLLFQAIPVALDQANINYWVISLKNAGGLTLGVKNLNTVYDVAYLFAVPDIEDTKINFAKGIIQGEANTAGLPNFYTYDGYQPVNLTSNAFNSKFNWGNLGNLAGRDNNHLFTSCSVESGPTTRTSISSSTSFRLSMFQRISGNNRVRSNNASTAYDNAEIHTNRKGCYYMQRVANTNSSAKNKSALTNISRASAAGTPVGYDLIVGGLNNGDNDADSCDYNARFNCLTLGLSGVDHQILSDGIRDYLLHYGIDLYYLVDSY